MNPSSGSLSINLYQSRGYVTNLSCWCFCFFFFYLCDIHRLYVSRLFHHRRKRAVLQAWRPSEAKKSRRRKFSSALWAPGEWASASPVVRPRNLGSTSAASSQAPCLQKSDLRWQLKKIPQSHFKFSSCGRTLNYFCVWSWTAGWWPDCGGEWCGFYQCGPQRGEFAHWNWWFLLLRMSVLHVLTDVLFLGS